MARRRISSGSPFEEAAAYSRVVVDGNWVFVSGCSGFDHGSGEIGEDVVAQTEQTFRNIERALGEAGATIDDVVRVSLILSDPADYPRIVPILKRHFDEARPASTAWAAALMDPRMKVEIEVTALRRGPDAAG